MKKNFYTFVFITLFLIIISIGSAFAKNLAYNVYKPKAYPTSTNFSDMKEKILFIVDFSNSMNENLGNKRKIDVALETLSNILPKINPETWTGLRVYGHKNGFTANQSCTASALVSPIKQNNSADIEEQLSSLNAVGWTPITYSLKKAVESDFSGFDGQKRIILLSDGGENCDESPCDYAINLMQYRDDIKIDVIAFNISDYDANSQLRCTALTTSGRFYTANTASELSHSLDDSLNMHKDVQGMIIKK